MKHIFLVREKKRTQQEQRKRKATLDSIEELKDKKKKIKFDIGSLLKSADEFSEKAESTGKMAFVTQSNSFRKTAKEKKFFDKTEQSACRTTGDIKKTVLGE